MRAKRRAAILAALLAVVAAGVATAVDSLGRTGTAHAACGSAGDPACPDPHGSYTATTDKCAICHRSHTGKNRSILEKAPAQSQQCFNCHNTLKNGSFYDTETQYTDAVYTANPNVPGTSSYYSHPATVASAAHTQAIDRCEFAAQSPLPTGCTTPFVAANRHSECGDCHNPHAASYAVVAAHASPGTASQPWAPSGALQGISGTENGSPSAWAAAVSYEYQLCLKCHSNYTALRSETIEAWKQLDKALEFSSLSSSYHPVQAIGTNQTSAMTNSLNGGTRYGTVNGNAFTPGSTIRCTHCHGNSRVTDSAQTASLAPHSSQYRGILVANYRDRLLSTSTQAYNSADFALCFLCHSAAPFSDVSGDPRSDTGFRFHGYHTAKIDNQGSGGTDINVAGAGRGNAICAECHFRIHGTKTAYLSTDQGNLRLVNFAPNVQPYSSTLTWNFTNKSCTMTCHGKEHTPKTY